MEAFFNLFLRGTNCSVKDISCWTTTTGDLFIVLKVCVESATLLG